MLRNPSAVAQHLAADVFADGGGAVQLKKLHRFKSILALIDRSKTTETFSNVLSKLP